MTASGVATVPTENLQAYLQARYALFEKVDLNVRIRIIMKSWIRIRIEVKIQEIWRAVHAPNGGPDASN
jgi:hypothetical protein